MRKRFLSTVAMALALTLVLAACGSPDDEAEPTVTRIPDAANWLGESMIAQGAYTEAADVLVDIYQKNAEHPRAPDLLLKLGVALAGAGERETACRTFDEVERRYTETIPAFKNRLSQERAKSECPPA